MRDYLANEGVGIAHRFELVSFKELFSWNTLPRGLYVFAGIDQLEKTQRELAERVWQLLYAAGIPTLNHPTKSLLRYPLLKALNEAGLNRFKARKATEPLEDLQYPVFVRDCNMHTGSLTRLLHSPDEVEVALRSLSWAGMGRNYLLVVEFLDTSDQSAHFRRYAACRVGKTIIAKSIKSSKHWVAKHSTKNAIQHPAEEEHAFVNENPHLSWLTRVFDLANIQYGRIDYSLLEAQPQIWEINTCPTLGPTTKFFDFVERRFDKKTEPTRNVFDSKFQCIWEELDDGVDAGGAPIQCSLPRNSIKKAERERLQQLVSHFHRRTVAAFQRRKLA